MSARYFVDPIITAHIPHRFRPKIEARETPNPTMWCRPGALARAFAPPSRRGRRRQFDAGNANRQLLIPERFRVRKYLLCGSQLLVQHRKHVSSLIACERGFMAIRHRCAPKNESSQLALAD